MQQLRGKREGEENRKGGRESRLTLHKHGARRQCPLEAKWRLAGAIADRRMDSGTFNPLLHAPPWAKDQQIARASAA
jgi:hypothetical protein